MYVVVKLSTVVDTRQVVVAVAPFILKTYFKLDIFLLNYIKKLDKNKLKNNPSLKLHGTQ